MVLLSSAIKGVPEDTLEAARIDGASEFQIFWRVVIPQIKGTIITVFVTVFITVLKVFDIVYVTTNGAYKHQRHREPLLQQAVRAQRGRAGDGHRRRPAHRGHPAHLVPGQALPRRGGNR